MISTVVYVIGGMALLAVLIKILQIMQETKQFVITTQQTGEQTKRIAHETHILVNNNMRIQLAERILLAEQLLVVSQRLARMDNAGDAEKEGLALAHNAVTTARQLYDDHMRKQQQVDALQKMP